MAEPPPTLAAPGLTVRLQPAVPAALLRYFAGAGDFAAALRRCGVSLPPVLGALEADGELLLAWRSPTETLCLAGSEQRIAALAQGLGEHSDGCLLDLTGTFTVFEIRGERTADLIARLGGEGTLPGPGESRRGRLADVAVTLVCRPSGELLLALDRGYAEHLRGWIEATMADFPAAPGFGGA